MKCKFPMSGFWLGIACLFLTQGLWGQSANLTGLGANTGCGYFPGRPAGAVEPKSRSSQSESEVRSPRLLLVSDRRSGSGDDNASIVGFWKVQLVLDDGTVFDDGYATWHSDGTELPYKLNHFALSWDSTGTVFVGPANIRETITVDPSGKTYRGLFALDQFDTNGNVLAHFAGKVIGLRITAD